MKGQDAFGFSAEDYGDECEVWSDNWPAFCLFNALATQWRTGACGATGLDYTSIRDVAGYLGIKKKQIAEIFPDLQVMEAEALLVMSESK
ncbi:DUF1799 domain-containing protein [Pseudomonas sp. B21-053]|uniref:DUF1799 domain-containing protein n=1 Tax=Pseudomonas sp. B21-053 TaxID=2895493 RepID=UPI0022329D93|nr:DUF1799 domain-containing protein [Pseudomonas sp. B21-053]UZE15177.1 DUF1799 domain-containing protein [Pseudomonas sp. B21-053]